MGAIFWQAVETRRSVEASHDGLRAWVGITVRENEFAPLTFTNSLTEAVVERLKTTPPQFEWEITNYGQTPAFVTSVAVHTAAYSSPSGGLGKIGKSTPVNTFLAPNTPKPHRLIPPDNFSKCEMGEMHWRVTVKITYKDAFGRHGETVASYHYSVPRVPEEPRKGFYQDSYPATNYNR